MACEFEFQTYTSEYKRAWDTFVDTSRNGTFLFRRDYMDYHSDRFADASLIATRKGRPVALLPACHAPEHSVSSHAGLTYGGWILPPLHLDGAAVLTLFDEWLAYCKAQHFTKIIYKPVPYIYASKPSQEELYALWRTGFQKSAVLLSSAIDLRTDWKFDMSKRRQVRMAQKDEFIISRSYDFAGYWQLLCQCLAERHGVSPVHSVEEILQLSEHFPDNIKLYTLCDAEGLQAGVCVYDTGRVAHAQYAATSAKARSKYYLTALYNHLLTEVSADRHYFDFGTSNEDAGRYLNAGLLNQKFAMGGSGVVYEQYIRNL